MLSDLNFNKCGEDSASLFSQHNFHPTYFYLLANYQNSIYGIDIICFYLPFTLWYYRTFKITIEADHNAITKFHFMKTPFSRQNDAKTSQMLVDLLTSFSSNVLRDLKKS